MLFVIFANNDYIISGNYNILQVAETLISFLLENVTCHGDTEWHSSVSESS